MSDICEIDLSRMTETPRCAVLCRTPYELDEFFFNARRQLSRFMTWNRDDIGRLWNVYEERTGFTLFTGRECPDHSMSYCNEEWFRNSGYEVIELSDFYTIPDIVESDEDIACLFGGAV